MTEKNKMIPSFLLVVINMRMRVVRMISVMLMRNEMIPS